MESRYHSEADLPVPGLKSYQSCCPILFEAYFLPSSALLAPNLLHLRLHFFWTGGKDSQAGVKLKDFTIKCSGLEVND